MSDIQTRQGDLLKDIYNFSEPQRTAPHTQIYQNNLMASAYKSLSIAYPCTEKLVGSEALKALAAMHLQQQPLQSSNWSDFGHLLPDMLASSEAFGMYPYLADIARYESLIFQSERSKNESFDQSSVFKLQESTVDNVYLRFQKSFRLLTSAYPIEDIYLANIDGGDDSDHHLQSAKEHLQSEQYQERLMIYRCRFKAQSKRLTKNQFLFVSSCINGASIGAALDYIEEQTKYENENDRLDLGNILSLLIQHQAIGELYIQ